MENAKKNRQTATKISPKPPKLLVNAACVRAVRLCRLSSTPGGQDGEYGQVQNDKSIDEYADHCRKPLFMRIFYVCPGVCVRVEPIPASFEKSPRATP